MSLFKSTDKQMEYAIALLRIIVGILFVAHGGQKLFQLGLDLEYHFATQCGNARQVAAELDDIAMPLFRIRQQALAL